MVPQHFFAKFLMSLWDFLHSNYPITMNSSRKLHSSTVCNTYFLFQ